MMASRSEDESVDRREAKSTDNFGAAAVGVDVVDVGVVLDVSCVYEDEIRYDLIRCAGMRR